MKNVKLVNCDLDASEISLGCMRISGMENQDIATLIHTALDAGVNFFDHADIYGGGQSEAKFAEALGDESAVTRPDDPANQMWHSEGLL